MVNVPVIHTKDEVLAPDLFVEDTKLSMQRFRSGHLSLESTRKKVANQQWRVFNYKEIGLCWDQLGPSKGIGRRNIIHVNLALEFMNDVTFRLPLPSHQKICNMCHDSRLKLFIRNVLLNWSLKRDLKWRMTLICRNQFKFVRKKLSSEMCVMIVRQNCSKETFFPNWSLKDAYSEVWHRIAENSANFLQQRCRVKKEISQMKISTKVQKFPHI